MREVLDERLKILLEAALLAVEMPAINQALRDMDQAPCLRGEIRELHGFIAAAETVEIQRPANRR